MTAPAQWMSVTEAATILGIPIVGLRRTIERNAVKSKDGHVVASVDGIVARKLGRMWRVHLDPAWTKPALAG